jgi:alpha-amylase
MKQWIFVLLAFSLILSACQSTPSMNVTTSPTPPSPGIHAWWDDAVFYEIFVRSFYDSNGDGIGDFNGITRKLDYLQSLGVNALWLMPIYPSPSYHGYDVTNYFDVNPDYGTLSDFKNLLAAAHQRGMHVILDMVLNHTSSQNPWFVSANSDSQSSYRNWYIWSDTNPGYMGPNGSIPWYQGQQGYYYAIFGAGMPDLNYQNPDVTTEMDKVISFWLKDVGVDGFRLDAINYLIEEGQKQANTPSTHAWLKNFYTAYKADKSDAFTVGEVYGADAALDATYTGNQLDMAFDFELASGMLNSVNGGSNSAVTSALTFAQQALPNWQFGTFLTNHDQNRTMSTLSGDVDKAKAAAFMLLTLPGTPFIYYGEEIGMQGEKPDEDIRLPMQWSAGNNAGFTTGTPWRAPNADYPQVNVVTEQNDPNSLLSFYRTLITLRNQHPALRDSSLSILSTQNTGIFAVLRYKGNETLLIVANLTPQAISDYSLSLSSADIPSGHYGLKAIFGFGSFADLAVTKDGFQNFKPLPELPAYSDYILQLQP